MAGRNNADSRHHLTVDASQQQIPKELQGPDNPIPLSPQWLLPKPGDNKHGIITGESHFSPHHGVSLDAVKALGNGEDFHEAGKKRDVYRLSHDAEAGRLDRWRDEERETNSAIRRDRWREGDKESGDTRRTERWSDNSSRHSWEACRAPSERWNDSGNREGNYDQRRDSKWNTRWGPDVKESDNWREKWSESGRDAEGSRDKGMPHLPSYGKDTDKEGEHYSRSWKSISSMTRERADSSHHHSLTPNKQSGIFGYGRGRGENGASAFPAGRGRINSSTNILSTDASRSDQLDKPDGAYGDPSTLRYNRMKLLDIYKMTDIEKYRMSLDGFIEDPSLTTDELLEPLALSAPTPDELVILKGIDKGDVSSGTQVSKDGSVGRNIVDAFPSKQTKLGGREDMPTCGDDYRNESSSKIEGQHFSSLESSPYEKRSVKYEPDPKINLDQNIYPYQETKFTVDASMSQRAPLKKPDELAIGEVSLIENSLPHHVTPWRSQSRDRLHWSSTEVGSRTSDVNWSHLRKDMVTEQNNNMPVTTSYYRDESYWQNNQGVHSEMRSESKMKRQPSEGLDREKSANILHAQEDPFSSRDNPAARNSQPHPSPEELSLYYKDPQGQIQGPFSGSDLIGWFEAGYFDIDLQVRHSSAPADAPFSFLGDVMPHLRMKARPPPGFGAAKQTDVLEVSNKEKPGSPGKVHSGFGEFEDIKNGHRSRHGSATEAENQFLESLMSGNMSSSALENFSITEGSDMSHLLAQRRLLEQQTSLPNPPFWSGRGSTSMTSKLGIIPDSSTPHLKLLPSMGDTSHQVPRAPQHADFLSILHTAADKSPSPAVSSGVPVWSNFPDVRPLNSTIHGGIDMVQDKMDMHHNQLLTSPIGFGVQHQRLQHQNQLSLSHIFNQPGDLSASLVPPEKFISSEIPQDPQTLSLLQQHYLLSQLQMQSQVSVPTQLSLLDKILFLKQQQQKQEQQRQLLLQQQQHLLSQVLSGHQSHQHFGDPSYAQLRAAMPAGIAPVDHVLRQMHDALQLNQQMPFLNLHDGHTSNIPNVNLQGSQDASYSVSSGALPLNLPHQIFDHPAHSKECNPTLSEADENVPVPDTLPTPATTESSSLFDAAQKSAEEDFVPRKNVMDLDNCTTRHTKPSMPQPSGFMTSIGSESAVCCISSEECPKASDFASSLSDQVHDLRTEDTLQPCQVELPVEKEAKNVEMREAKKTSEKKSRKQKKKLQPALDLEKGLSRKIPCQQPKLHTEGADSGDAKSEVHVEFEKSSFGISSGVGGEKSILSTTEPVDSQQASLSSSITIIGNEVETIEGKAKLGEAETSAFNAQTTSNHRAWKPAPGLKPKSLVQIQQEEQQRAQTEKMSSEIDVIVIPASIPLPAPWVGIVGNLEHKSSRDIVRSASNTESTLGKSENILSSKSMKSQLHDLLAEEALTKSNEGDKDIASVIKGSTLTNLPLTGAQVEVTAVDDDDFVEAKDTKKSRKKASKAKGAGVKAPSPVGSADLSAPFITMEKGRTTRQAQQEKETLPIPPAGPSFGDFVFWKGDQPNPVPAPAWSTDSGKPQKPTSLRDIQREQGKKTPLVQQHIPISAPAKVQSNQGSHGSGSSWQVTGSSPSKAASPIQTTSLTNAQSKSKIVDDLFWGPLKQSKQETKQSDFPSLSNSSSRGVKSTSVKGAPGVASSRQKPSTSRLAEYTLSSSPASGLSFSKGRRDETTKHSEAMDFREWCERELVRLTGTNDTNFLEYCLKQSTSEAEMLLKENLGSLDRNHEFIDKLINYKEFLSSDVIEMAFQAPNSRKVTGHGVRSRNSEAASGISEAAAIRDANADMEVEHDGAAKVGKKKGKKGKKVSSAVLGFNIVSNRIMMGEIQTAED